jgi:nitroreductase
VTVETWDAIRGRRSVRSFAPRPIEPEHVERILDAGRRAPSSKNTQRWEFVLVEDREQLRRLSEVGDFAGHLAGATAAVALIVPEAEDPERREWVAFDVGHASENMMLAARDLGIGSVHAAVYDEALAREILGLPEGWRCFALISFGYPDDAATFERPAIKGNRRPLEEIVHRDRW